MKTNEGYIPKNKVDTSRPPKDTGTGLNQVNLLLYGILPPHIYYMPKTPPPYIKL